MVKRYWLVVIFAAGIALGLWLERVPDSGQRAEPVVISPPPTARTPPPARTADAPPVHPAASPPEPVSNGSAPAAPLSMIIENAPADRWDYGDYSGYSLPVDAGPRFGAQIAESIRAGRNDTLAREHVQLEREVRDDSWAYPLEAELHDMLAADPVMGEFKVEHLECRATLCELRVSGKDRLQQSSAVNQWLHDMNQLRWPGGLTVGTAIFSGTENGSEGMLMLRKPPAQG